MNQLLSHNGITLNFEAELRKWALEQTRAAHRDQDITAWVKAADELFVYVKSGKQPS